MTGKDQHIDSLLRKKLADAQAAPPPDVWANVSSRMVKKNKKKAMLFFARVAATLLILLSGISIYYFTVSPTNTEEITENTPATKDEPQSIFQEKKLPAEEQQVLSTDNNGSKGDNAELTVPKEQKSFSQANSTIGNTGVSLSKKQPKTSKKVGIKMAGKQKNQALILSPESEKSKMEMVSDKMSPQPELRDPLGAFVESPEHQLMEKPLATNLDQPMYTITDNYPMPKTYDRWQLGAFYAPLYSYRMIESADVSAAQNQIIQQSEKGLVSYSGGLTVAYQIGRRMKISSGLNVTKMSNSIENIVAYVSHYNKNDYMYDGSASSIKVSYQVNNSMGNIQTTQTDAELNNDPILEDLRLIAGEGLNSLNTAVIGNSSEIIQDFTYIEFPVLLKYSIIESKIDVNLLTGVSSFFMLDNEVTFKNHGGDKVSGRTNNVRTTNFSGSLGVGLAYDVSKAVQFYIDPVFKLFLSSINTSERIDTYPYSFGLYSGLSFFF